MPAAADGLKTVAASLPWVLPLPSAPATVSELRSMVEDSSVDSCEAPAQSKATAMHSVREAGGREALAEVLQQYASSERSGGEVGGAMMGNLDQLLGSALRR